MSNNNIIQIHQDVLINDILDKLSIPDLIHVLESEKSMYDKFYPVFADKINYYKYQKQVASPKYMEYIEHEKKRINAIASIYEKNRLSLDLLILSPQLASFMNVNHLPQLQGGTLYMADALELWIKIYAKINGLNTLPDKITINKELENITGYRDGEVKNYNEILTNLYQQRQVSPVYLRPAPSQMQIAAIINELANLEDIYDRL